MTDKPIRIAMWSTWRSLSTALMRAWENREDTCVLDEPLFPHYLYCLHNGWAIGPSYSSDLTILEQYETDWQKIVASMTVAPLPPGKRIQFQKHITLYAHPPMTFDWITQISNAFLIREPRAMLASLYNQRPSFGLEDTGWPQLERIFMTVSEATGSVPPLITAEELQQSPRHTLSLLCDALGVDFNEQMLHWPEGPRPSDAPWGYRWYTAVHNSTGFKAYTPKPVEIPSHLNDVAEACERIYLRLAEHRLTSQLPDVRL